jgi:3'-phosphoadenosine 5'-phosphosulfate sulfotransferase (PAPS reductase)/FAD synthetase
MTTPTEQERNKENASQQYHTIERILNEFKNGATYTESIGRIQFIISTLTRQHEEEMDAARIEQLKVDTQYLNEERHRMTERFAKIIRTHLEYCQEQNGLP